MCLRLSTHFPSGLDSLPDAEEADNPHCQETQGQVPLQGPYVLDPSGDAQDVASAEDTDAKKRLMAGCGGTETEEVTFSNTPREVGHVTTLDHETAIKKDIKWKSNT